MLRKFILIWGLAMALSAPAPARAAGHGAGLQTAPASPVSYDVSAFGFRVGDLRFSSRESARGYSVEARFRTTGLTRLLRRMGFVMKARGLREGDRFTPLSYSEEVNTGRRSSSARMRYDKGVPTLVAGKVSDGETPVLDPATQGGTIDPLTALFLVLRDQPAETLCRIDRPMFDGARRSRIRLLTRTPAGSAVICTGHFRRVAGYSPEDLATRRKVAFRVTYEPVPGANGMMRARSVRLQTSYGPVALTRR